MRVLIALDGSAECEVSLPVAARLVDALNADVDLLQVIDGFASTKGHVHHEPEWPGGIAAEVLAIMKKSRTYLDEVVSRYELPPDRTRCMVGRSENPAEEIVTIARNNDIDLIVMAGHCRTWLGRLTQGSVCSDVIRSRVCPVLCVPLRQTNTHRQHHGVLAGRN
jgi:nucleotide-binding universal stress UspA family protein